MSFLMAMHPRILGVFNSVFRGRKLVAGILPFVQENPEFILFADLKPIPIESIDRHPSGAEAVIP